ncbi:hypothetical protein F0562_017539 [Nyssa sinensis]|uniref:Uncharacterized protein n=1 Tax=Nyssa sinensis TaxID=561372 RepID=A0A5J4ZGR7_9ASTE|nr:hypothetical protein F0562_017539 [Nyssa sinensis]
MSGQQNRSLGRWADDDRTEIAWDGEKVMENPKEQEKCGLEEETAHSRTEEKRKGRLLERWEGWFNRIVSRAEQKTIDQLQNRDLPKIPKVSIGPYHYHKRNPDSKIGEMEAVKERAVILFFNLLNRCERKTSNGQFINNFAQKMKGVREWYDKDSTTDIDEMDFVMMMFLDGCFIIMFIFCILLSNVEELGMTKRTANLVEKDILMLENQLPFQVLLELCTENGFSTSDLLSILRRYIGYCTRGFNRDFHLNDLIGPFMFGCPADLLSILRRLFCLLLRHALKTKWNSCFKYPKKTQTIILDPNPLHLLDLLRKAWIGKSSSNLNKKWNSCFKCPKKKETIFLVRSVKELTAGPTGISLRPNISCRLSDINFSYFLYGRLTLPPLIFNDLTKTIFINAIAQEECTENEFVFSSYVKFLDLLMDNADDVKVMQSAGIMKNIQGNEEELANFINIIGAAVEPQSAAYKDVKREMGNYIASKRRTWLNEVIHDYFRSPWTIIAFLAGIFLLFLTVVQTYFAAFPHPGNGN